MSQANSVGGRQQAVGGSSAGVPPPPTAYRLPPTVFYLAVFVVAAALNLAWLGRAPLFEPSETRHAEVGREFAAEGHWLVPTHNGWPHLTKPPLADWLVAAGLRLFGENEFGARFFTALIAALSLTLAAAFAGALAGRAAALAAAVLYLISPLYLVHARVISIDIILAAVSTGGYLLLWKLAQRDCPRSWLKALGLGALLGVGFMAKGHIILLMLLAPALVWIIAGRRWPTLKRLTRPALPLLAFVVIGLPWFSYIAGSCPGWLATIGNEEFRERVAGRLFGRWRPGLSVLFLLGGCLPALPLAALPFMKHWPEEARPAKGLLAAWILLPLAVLSLVVSQQMNYLAPLVPAVAILGGVGWAHLAAQWATAPVRARAMAYLSAGLLAVMGGLALAGTPRFLLKADWDFELANLGVLLGAAALMALAGSLALLALYRRRLRTAGLLYLAAAAAIWAVSISGIEEYHEQHTARETCLWIRRHLGAEVQPVVFREYIHGAGFYLHGRVRIINPRGTTLKWSLAWPNWPGGFGEDSLLTKKKLVDLAGGGDQWVVVYSSRAAEFSEVVRQYGLQTEIRRLEPDVCLVRLRPGA